MSAHTLKPLLSKAYGSFVPYKVQADQQIMPLKITSQNLPQHEAEAQRLLYHLFNKPSEMSRVPVSAEDSARRWEPTSKTWVRPGTGDTFSKLIHLNPDINNFLIVTSQPYVLYMDAVYKKQLALLVKPPQIDVVGPKAPSTTRTIEYMNAVHDWLKAMTPLVEPIQ